MVFIHTIEEWKSLYSLGLKHVYGYVFWKGSSRIMHSYFQL